MNEIYLIKIEDFCINNSGKEVNYNGQIYTSFPHFTFKNSTESTNLQPNAHEFEFIFSQNFQNKPQIFSAFHEKNIAAFKKSGGTVVQLAQGMVYNIEITTNGFIVKIQSNLYKIAKPMTKKYSQVCRASFCDSSCQLNIVNYKELAQIDFLSGSEITLASSPKNYTWAGGICTISGITYKIKAIDGRVLRLFEIPSCTVGETVEITAACNKTLESCKKYENILNFQGEPFIYNNTNPLNA